MSSLYVDLHDFYNLGVASLSSVASPIHWGAFLLAVVAMLVVDLGVFDRGSGPKVVRFRQALAWSALWVLLSLLFSGFLWIRFGHSTAFEFLSAYVIEKSLSIDNIFVFVIIFRYMKINRAYLHRVLMAGIFGALVLRATFIFVGLSLIELFSWTLYLFGLFLTFTGIKLLAIRNDAQTDSDGKDSWVKRMAERWLRVTDQYEGPLFFVRHDGQNYVTTLFVTLLMIETADVVFALDSIPAIFGVSRDPYVVFTSNVCAILGLRAMFFLLETIVDRFRYLQIGVALVLTFIGVKMLLAEGLGGMLIYRCGVGPQVWLDPLHIPTGWSLFVVASILLLSIVASLMIPESLRSTSPPPPTNSSQS